MDTKTVKTLALGLALGLGGGELGKRALLGADAAPLAPFIHAVDLRRSASEPNVKISAWGDELAPDGGVAKDLGQLKCDKPTNEVGVAATALMTALARACH